MNKMIASIFRLILHSVVPSCGALTKTIAMVIVLCLLQTSTDGATDAKRENIELRTYKLAPPFFTAINNDAELRADNVKGFLKARDILFPLGSRIEYDEGHQLLRVWNTLSQQNSIWQVLLRENMVHSIVKIEILVFRASGATQWPISERNIQFEQFAADVHNIEDKGKYNFSVNLQTPKLIVCHDEEGGEQQFDVGMMSADQIRRKVASFSNAGCMAFYMVSLGEELSTVKLHLVCSINRAGWHNPPLEFKLETHRMLDEGVPTLLACVPHLGEVDVDEMVALWDYLAIKVVIVPAEDE
jgi:hypothetical protein